MTYAKRFVIGDIHGRFKPLKEVLSKANFDYQSDKLIVLGDIVDGGYFTAQVVEELLKIENLVFVLGNHDEWFMNHIASGWAENIWLHQGGANTLKSYGGKVGLSDFITDPSQVNTANINIPVTHQDFFNKAVFYHIEDNMLFVHGGINPAIPKIESQSKYDLLWDRYLIRYAQKNRVQDWNRVFVGHTSTQAFGKDHPIRYNNLIMMDCGSGWNGRLAIMNIDTEEYFLSRKQKPAIE